MKNILDILQERELLDAVTDPQLRTLLNKPTKVYCGFDPTADGLHLGSMAPLMLLAWFQRCGHTPVALLGGATGMIGDPSGKSQERNLLSDEDVERNVQGIRKDVEKFLDFNHPTAKPVLLNNADWFKKFSLISFLRDVGKLFRVGPMLAKESVKARLNSEEGLSFTEFSYQLFQAYDFLYLYQNHGVTVQIGGSDQWGNITAGIDLVRKVTGAQVYGATMPLLTGSDGKKFGKSESGAVWLSADKLSPYDFYQHLIRTPDADVIKLLKKLTFLELEEIAALEREMPNKPNHAQTRLAEEVTRIVHGEEGLKRALQVTAAMSPGSETVLNASLLSDPPKDMPIVDFKQEGVLNRKLVELIVETGLCTSNSEARRLVRQGGGYLNNQKIADEHACLKEQDIVDGILFLLSAGKKKKVLIRIAK